MRAGGAPCEVRPARAEHQVRLALPLLPHGQLRRPGRGAAITGESPETGGFGASYVTFFGGAGLLGAAHDIIDGGIVKIG